MDVWAPLTLEDDEVVDDELTTEEGFDGASEEAPEEAAEEGFEEGFKEASEEAVEEADEEGPDPADEAS